MVEFIGIFYDQTVMKDPTEQSRFVEVFSSKFQNKNLSVLSATKPTKIRFRWAKRSIASVIENCHTSIRCSIINRASNANKARFLPFRNEIDRCYFLVLMARQLLLSLFEQIFPGDQMVCHYLLLHLLSRIYVRQPSLAYGKLSLNISHISDEQSAALEEILNFILPLHSRLPITVNTLKHDAIDAE